MNKKKKNCKKLDQRSHHASFPEVIREEMRTT